MTDRDGDHRGRAAPVRVAVVVPFAGDEGAARRVASWLARMTRPDVDCVLVDNTSEGLGASAAEESGVRSVAARHERSSYHARNVGFEATEGEWILFVDADCEPPDDLVERYLSTRVDPEVGALGGAVAIPEGQRGILADWARSRAFLSQERLLSGDPPVAVSANLLVRRSALQDVGGFCEGIRSGGDIELCWRLAAAGWRVEGAPGAAVEHPARSSMRAVRRQFLRYGAGNAWQARRFPSLAPVRPGPMAVATRLLAALALVLSARLRRGSMALLDAYALTYQRLGWLLDNRAAGSGAVERGRSAISIVTDLYPVVSETFVEADARGLRGRGWRVRIEAVARPARPRRGGARGLRVCHAEDEGPLSRLGSVAWCLARHPMGTVLDLRFRRRFDRRERMPLRALAPQVRRLDRLGDQRVLAHFGAGASVGALRAARIVGVPVAIDFHGHEIYREPKSLTRKLADADLVITPCDYTARDLRAQLPEGDHGKVHRVIVGVDPERFRRETPYPQGTTVVSVGRLVEKKGYTHLLDAVSILRRQGRAPERVVIAGDGPLRDELASQVERLGLDDLVEMPGAIEPERVRDLLEEASIFCLPCVVAADGDRDSMPLVVKEAMAMEVPVVVSREVGLPEIVEDGWGRLADPGDAEGLAAALAEVLEMGHEERLRLGRAGREAVTERANLETELDRLSRLMAGEPAAEA